MMHPYVAVHIVDWLLPPTLKHTCSMSSMPSACDSRQGASRDPPDTAAAAPMAAVLSTSVYVYPCTADTMSHMCKEHTTSSHAAQSRTWFVSFQTSSCVGTQISESSPAAVRCMNAPPRPCRSFLVPAWFLMSFQARPSSARCLSSVLLLVIDAVWLHLSEALSIAFGCALTAARHPVTSCHIQCMRQLPPDPSQYLPGS